jgi:chromosomal replication initiation ATPase DnaA
VRKRFREKVIKRAIDFAPFGWGVWIEPLEVVEFDGKTMTLRHKNFPESSVWIDEHYGEIILQLLNEDVKEKISVEFTSKKGEI